MEEKMKVDWVTLLERVWEEASISSRVNIFITHEGDIDVEPIAGPLGAGEPAQPSRYAVYWLNVHIGDIEPFAAYYEPERVLDMLWRGTGLARPTKDDVAAVRTAAETRLDAGEKNV